MIQIEIVVEKLGLSDLSAGSSYTSVAKFIFIPCKDVWGNGNIGLCKGDML